MPILQNAAPRYVLGFAITHTLNVEKPQGIGKPLYVCVMAESIDIAPGVFIPADAIVTHATRSSGPGGQHVNKVSSKIEMRVDLTRVLGIDDGARSRLRNLVRNMVDADGWLLVKSQRTRDQHQNLEDARTKVRELVAQAMVRPKPRRPTKPSRGSNERRIAEKKARSRTKSTRSNRDD
jgi:ribosome-associated protein